MTITLSTRPMKAVLAWIGTYLFRLIPFRPANFEPMLATLMPYSKKSSLLGSFLFGFLGIALFDAVTSGFGIWTFVTAASYGVLGIAGHFFFKNRMPSRANFLAFGLAGTLCYDAVTATIGPLFFGQPIMLAFTGQIPFTLMHLLGTALFSISLSPALAKWFAKNSVIQIRFSRSRLPAFVTVSK